jgi:hypothetical protein
MFFNFWSSKPWIRIRIGIQPKRLEPDPNLMNPDPKHCFVQLRAGSGSTTQTFRNQDLDLMKAVELEKSGSSSASPRKKEKKVSAASQNVMAGWLKKQTPKVKAEKDDDSSRGGEDEENILRPQLAEEVGILTIARYGIGLLTGTVMVK